MEKDHEENNGAVAPQPVFGASPATTGAQRTLWEQVDRNGDDTSGDVEWISGPAGMDAGNLKYNGCLDPTLVHWGPALAFFSMRHWRRVFKAIKAAERVKPELFNRLLSLVAGAAAASAAAAAVSASAEDQGGAEGSRRPPRERVMRDKTSPLMAALNDQDRPSKLHTMTPDSSSSSVAQRRRPNLDGWYVWSKDPIAHLLDAYRDDPNWLANTDVPLLD